MTVMSGSRLVRTAIQTNTSWIFRRTSINIVSYYTTPITWIETTYNQTPYKERTEMDANDVIMEMCGKMNDETTSGVSWEIRDGSVQYTVDTYQYLARQDLQLDDTTDTFNALPAEMKEKVMMEFLGVDIYHYSFSEEIDFTQRFYEAYSDHDDLDEYVFLTIHKGGDVRVNWSEWMMFRMVKDNQLTAPEIEGTCTRNGVEYRISNWDGSPSKGVYGITFMDNDGEPYPDNEDFLDDDVIELRLENTY